MGVPFEALLPYGIMLAMFGITGAGLSKIRHMQNGGKRARHSVDAWDRQSNTYECSEIIQC
ncbi:NADh:ubiquinone oxidoreductase kda subunit protein [Rutstroemia sp. NJR-2017a BBW]|nr:NADh:ubiquinone oxidoreductase kda subunit protein [Rutstroemia sp. NJR-2017a BBW]